MNNQDIQKQHFYWLDAIRFLAAFTVLFSHSRMDYFSVYVELPAEQHNHLAFAFYMLGRLGHEAVIIFFVLSGFLVGGRGFERMRTKSLKVKSYMIDRFSRIYPPLIMSVFFYYITCFFIPTQNWEWSTAIGNILNLQGIACKSLVSPYWSLSYEWWFYLCLAMLAIAYQSQNSKKRLLGLIGFCLTVSVFLVNKMSLHYFVIWLIGALSYLIRPQEKSKVAFYGSLLGIIVGIVLYQLSKDTRSINLPLNINNPKLVELFLCLMVCVFLQQIILRKPKTKTAIFIENKLGYMGNFSYSLYLSHRIWMMWIFYFIYPEKVGQMTLMDFIKYISLLLICLIGCWLMYLGSERYTPQIKKYLKRLLLNNKLQ